MLNDEIEALQRQSLSIYHQLGAFIEAVVSNQAQQEQLQQLQKQAEVEARRQEEEEALEQEPTPAEAAAVARHDDRPLTREETTKLLLLLSRASAAGLVDPDVRK
jgi:acetyl-CoA carboxylase alpha subunit